MLTICFAETSIFEFLLFSEEVLPFAYYRLRFRKVTFAVDGVEAGAMTEDSSVIASRYTTFLVTLGLPLELSTAK